MPEKPSSQNKLGEKKVVDALGSACTLGCYQMHSNEYKLYKASIGKKVCRERFHIFRKNLRFS